jgi:hypothetical protein
MFIYCRLDKAPTCSELFASFLYVFTRLKMFKIKVVIYIRSLMRAMFYVVCQFFLYDGRFVEKLDEVRFELYVA